MFMASHRISSISFTVETNLILTLTPKMKIPKCCMYSFLYMENNINLHRKKTSVSEMKVETLLNVDLLSRMNILITAALFPSYYSMLFMFMGLVLMNGNM